MNDDALQSLLDKTASELGIVGAQLAIFDGARLREFATGRRNQELDLPTTTSTLFQIGSTTKVFNAAVVMSVVDWACSTSTFPSRSTFPTFDSRAGMRSRPSRCATCYR